MRGPVRILLIALAAIAIVGALVAGFLFLPASKGAALSREQLMVGVLSVFVLGVVATGFDLREWL